MRISMYGIFAVTTALLISACSMQRERSATFDPPYPQTNSSADPIGAVFEGRIPCSAAQCEKLKVQLVIYERARDQTPSTYWLGVIGTQGNDRVVSEGACEVRRGLADYPQALVYQLEASAFADLRYFWRLNDDIVLVLDEQLRPRVGNAAWGYMLSRYTAAYGPRTYVLD